VNNWRGFEEIRMNGKIGNAEMFEEQLFEARSMLFSASNVKQIRFLQNKIKYLEQQVKESKRR